MIVKENCFARCRSSRVGIAGMLPAIVFSAFCHCACAEDVATPGELLNRAKEILQTLDAEAKLPIGTPDGRTEEYQRAKAERNRKIRELLSDAKAAGLESLDYDCCIAIARCSEIAEDHEDCLVLAESAAKLHSDREEAYFLKARMLLNLGRIEECESLATELDKRFGEASEVRTIHGPLYAFQSQRGNHAAAMGHLNLFLDYFVRQCGQKPGQGHRIRRFLDMLRDVAIKTQTTENFQLNLSKWADELRTAEEAIDRLEGVAKTTSKGHRNSLKLSILDARFQIATRQDNSKAAAEIYIRWLAAIVDQFVDDEHDMARRVLAELRIATGQRTSVEARAVDQEQVEKVIARGLDSLSRSNNLSDSVRRELERLLRLNKTEASRTSD